MAGRGVSDYSEGSFRETFGLEFRFAGSKVSLRVKVITYRVCSLGACLFVFSDWVAEGFPFTELRLGLER